MTRRTVIAVAILAPVTGLVVGLTAGTWADTGISVVPVPGQVVNDGATPDPRP